MGFKAIYDENVTNHLKLPQKVPGTQNLRSNNKGILINANQQTKSELSKNKPRIYLTNYPQTFYQLRNYQVSKPRLRRKQSPGGALRNFKKFTGEHLCHNLFFNKVAGLGLDYLLFSYRTPLVSASLKNLFLNQVLARNFKD